MASPAKMPLSGTRRVMLTLPDLRSMSLKPAGGWAAVSGVDVKLLVGMNVPAVKAKNAMVGISKRVT